MYCWINYFILLLCGGLNDITAFISCNDELVLYVIVCTIDDGGCVFDVSIVIGVADMVFDELHLI